MWLTAAAAALALGLLAQPLAAQTLRVAMQGDAGTMDPHAQNSQITNTILSMIYEPLVLRDRSLAKAPGLALSWEATGDTTWRFKLRPDVKYHNGNAFGADDVKFSVERAQAPTSQFANLVGGITAVNVIDDLTVEFQTATIDPLLPDKLSALLIMDSDWAAANNVTVPQDLKAEENTFAVLNANGTGPFTLAERVPDTRTRLTRAPNYWGEMADPDLAEVVFLPISSPPTRISALLSGEVDLVLDVPPQDVARLESSPGIRTERIEELRTIFFGYDQASDSLKYGDAGGKNPFKDKRVRQAVELAMDADSIARVVMRGLATPNGTFFAPGNFGYDDSLAKRAGFDPDKARALLAEAGFPDGFSVRMDCPTDAYINPEQICQAVSAMLAQVGIRVQLNLMPRAQFIPLLWEKDTSFFIIGFNTTYFDGMYVLETLLMTQTGKDGEGIYNYSGYSNPAFDDVVRKARVTLDPEARRKLMVEAYQMAKEDVAYAPLHSQVLVYAMKDNVDVQMRPDNILEIRWAEVK
jgi:peptide/nickel transport system substrate-binding protein